MREILREDEVKVKDLLNQTLGLNSYKSIERMGGLTNHTYHVILTDGREFSVRIPGEGTEEIIDRKNEKVSTELACRLGVDAKMLYFGIDGSKVTEYIGNAITMSSDELKKEEHIEQIANIFRTMHSCGIDTGVPFEVFEMAASYERIIRDNQVSLFDDYAENKAIVMDIKQQIDLLIKPAKVPCHNDPLCENWVEGDGRMYLIDWEYAGMNDGMWDLADVSIEAGFDKENDMLLLEKYLGRKPDSTDIKHFVANKIYVDYLWTLWAKARVPYDGQPMEDWASERYDRLKSNIIGFKNI